MEALKIAQESGQEKTGAVASILHNLAVSKHGQGEYIEAERYARQGLELQRTVRGNTHPETG
jgi:hypothetical protein